MSQLREFVKQIPRLKEAFLQLTMHINLTERITAVTNNKQFRDLWNLERGAVTGMHAPAAAKPHPRPRMHAPGILVGESAMDRIFDMIPRQTKVQTVLRLACLQVGARGVSRVHARHHTHVAACSRSWTMALSQRCLTCCGVRSFRHAPAPRIKRLCSRH